MGILFTPRPKLTYVPPTTGGRPTLLGAPDPAQSNSPPSTPALPADPLQGARRSAVIRNLPGIGNTYLDSEFAPKVDTFISSAGRQGVNLEFTSGYRSPEANQDLIDRPGAHGVVSPAARDSLHMAGLAVDVRYKDLDDATKTIIRNSAEDAGLSWGGSFSDLVHFHSDPGVDRSQLISNFTDQVRRLSSSPVRSGQ